MIIILHASLGGRVSAADIATPPKVSGVIPQRTRHQSPRTTDGLGFGCGIYGCTDGKYNVPMHQLAGLMISQFQKEGHCPR